MNNRKTVTSSSTRQHQIRQALSNKQGSVNNKQEAKKELFKSQRQRRVESKKPANASARVSRYPIKPPHFMNQEGTFKHSGDLGDLYYSLPIIRYYGGGTLFLNPYGLNTKKVDGTPSGLNETTMKMVMPLLEIQPYIKEVKKWNSSISVAVNIDDFRGNFHFPATTLCGKILGNFNVPFSETDNAWITCDPIKVAPTVFARSFRYRNGRTDYAPLKQKYKDCIFVGLPAEHADFERCFGKISFFPVQNFLQMAQVINGAERLIGNQSSPMALAIAMHKPFIQEAWKYASDCVFTRPDSAYMRM